MRGSSSFGVVTASVIGRLPIGMLSLALVLHMRAATGSYVVAGAAAAGYALGSGAGSPLLGRLADRLGQRPVLLATAAGGALPLVVLVAAPQPVEPTISVSLATLAGMLTPPLTACIRALWPKLVRSAWEADRAYAFDAILIELIYFLGPIIVAATVALASPAAGVLLAAFLGAIGSVTFAMSPASQDWHPEPEAGRRPSALRTPGMLVIVTVLLVWSVAFGVLEVAVPAFANLHGVPASAGVLLAAFAAGSVVGGLWYGARAWHRPAVERHRLALVAYAVGLIPLSFANSIPAMLILITIAGLSLAPVASSAFRLVPEIAPPGTLTEAYAWIEMALAAGLAIGAAITGWLVDAAGVKWALSTALAGPMIAIGAATLGRSRLDQRLPMHQ
ncbi:MAG: MFS transporter [Actinomycetota bacterium]